MKRGSLRALRGGWGVTPVSSPGGAPGGTEALRKQRLWGARQEAGCPQRRWGRVLARPCAAHGDAPRGDPRLLADRSEVLCGESAREGGQTSREAGPGCSWPCGAERGRGSFPPAPASALVATRWWLRAWVLSSLSLPEPWSLTAGPHRNRPAGERWVLTAGSCHRHPQ